MIPRFTRGLLLLTALSLLVIPMGSDVVEAQNIPPHLVATIDFDVSGCHDPMFDLISHRRCHGGQLRDIRITLEARRRAADPGPPRHVTCIGHVPGPIEFRERATVSEGRGRLGPVTIEVPGRLTHSGEHTTHNPPNGCRIRLEGDFHRVNSFIFGRLTIDVHVDTGVAARQFRHVYCARFETTVVPTVVGDTVGVAALVGGTCPGDDHPGRGPSDDADLHHGRCVMSTPSC